MSKPSMKILVLGATWSIGRLVVEESLRQGHSVPGAAAIQQHLIESVAAFCGGQFEDDASFMVILIA